MTGNPFDAGEGEWQVVVNDRDQHALWRPFLGLPPGWRVVVPGTDREAALAYVELNCNTLQPVERAGTDARSAR